MGGLLCQRLQDQCFSNFNMHTKHQGILLKCKFRLYKRVGVGAGLRFHISNHLLVFRLHFE